MKRGEVLLSHPLEFSAGPSAALLLNVSGEGAVISNAGLLLSLDRRQSHPVSVHVDGILAARGQTCNSKRIRAVKARAEHVAFRMGLTGGQPETRVEIQVCEAQRAASKGEWQRALAHMLAVQLFFDASDDKWISEYPVQAAARLRSFPFAWRCVVVA